SLAIQIGTRPRVSNCVIARSVAPNLCDTASLTVWPVRKVATPPTGEGKARSSGLLTDQRPLVLEWSDDERENHRPPSRLPSQGRHRHGRRGIVVGNTPGDIGAG